MARKTGKGIKGYFYLNKNDYNKITKDLSEIKTLNGDTITCSSLNEKIFCLLCNNIIRFKQDELAYLKDWVKEARHFPNEFVKKGEKLDYDFHFAENKFTNSPVSIMHIIDQMSKIVTFYALTDPSINNNKKYTSDKKNNVDIKGTISRFHKNNRYDKLFKNGFPDSDIRNAIHTIFNDPANRKAQNPSPDHDIFTFSQEQEMQHIDSDDTMFISVDELRNLLKNELSENSIPVIDMPSSKTDTNNRPIITVQTLLNSDFFSKTISKHHMLRVMIQMELRKQK